MTEMKVDIAINIGRHGKGFRKHFFRPKGFRGHIILGNTPLECTCSGLDTFTRYVLVVY
jgi:hypothetical protein